MEQEKRPAEKAFTSPRSYPSFASEQQERLSAPVPSLVLDFQKQIADATEKKAISSQESQWWMQGVEATLDQNFDDEKTLQILQELREYFRQNIIFNAEKNEIRGNINRVMRTSHMSGEDHALWERKLSAIDRLYAEQKITLQQSLTELNNLYELLSSYASSSSEDAPLQIYQSIVQACSKISFQHFLYLRSRDVIPEWQFAALSKDQRADILQNIMRKTGEEFSSFISLYPEYAQSAKAQQRWTASKTVFQKIQLLSRLYCAMKEGEQKRLQERKSIETLIENKKLTEAAHLLRELQKKLWQNTFSFFGFVELGKRVMDALSLRQRFMDLALQQEREERYDEAIKLLFQANDIELVSDFQHHLAVLSQKAKADALYKEGKQLIGKGKREKGGLLIRQAKLLNPLLQSRAEEPSDVIIAASPMEQRQKALEALRTFRAQDERLRVISMEEYIIRKVRQAATGEGKSTLNKKRKPVILSSEKNVVSLDTHDSHIEKGQFIRFKTEQTNVKETVEKVFRSAQEGTLSIEQMIFQKNDEDTNTLNLEEAENAIDEKKKTAMKKKKEQIARQYGVDAFDEDALVA